MVYHSSYPPRGNFQTTPLDRRRLILKPVPAAVSPWGKPEITSHTDISGGATSVLPGSNLRSNLNTKSNRTRIIARKRAQYFSFLLGHFQQVQISCKREQLKRTFRGADMSAKKRRSFIREEKSCRANEVWLKKRWWMSSQRSEKDGWVRGRVEVFFLIVEQVFLQMLRSVNVFKTLFISSP